LLALQEQEQQRQPRIFANAPIGGGNGGGSSSLEAEAVAASASASSSYSSRFSDFSYCDLESSQTLNDRVVMERATTRAAASSPLLPPLPLPSGAVEGGKKAAAADV
jgi:hypothetical protein